MLSDSDLHAIGVIVEEKVDKKLEPVLEAVREGFESVDRKFEQVDRRFEQVDRRFEQVDGRLEQMASKADLGALRHELMDHTDRTVQKAVGDLRVELKGDIGSLRAELRERDLIG